MYLSPEGLTAVSGSPDLANLTLRGLDSQLISLKRQVGPPQVTGDSQPWPVLLGSKHPGVSAPERGPGLSPACAEGGAEGAQVGSWRACPCPFSRCRA